VTGNQRRWSCRPPCVHRLWTTVWTRALCRHRPHGRRRRQWHRRASSGPVPTLDAAGPARTSSARPATVGHYISKQRSPTVRLTKPRRRPDRCS